MNIFKNIFFLILVFFSACTSFPLDPSPAAFASGDSTLAVKACDGPLASGFGVCRVTIGTARNASWVAILPKIDGAILGGQLVVHLNGVPKSYTVPQNGIVEVPLADLYGPGNWEASDLALITAVAQIQVKFATGLQGVVQAEGEVLLRPLAVGYDPMAIDSGVTAWGTVCKVQYSSAGRGAVSCK